MFKILTKKQYNELIDSLKNLHERLETLEKENKKPKYFGGN